MVGEIGTVQPGALADFVVVNADPTRDIHVLEDPTANVAAVMINRASSRTSSPRTAACENGFGEAGE